MRALREKARERLKGSACRVCRLCDGRACAGEVPGMGGIGTGASFHNNIAALASVRLAMRVLHGADNPDTSVELWGRQLALPVLAAPIGGVQGTIESGMDYNQYTRSLVSGCEQAGTLAGIGDGIVPERFDASLEAIGDKAGIAIPFIKPWPFDAVAARMEIAAKRGCTICGMDVDAAGLTALRRSGAPVGTRPFKELQAYIAFAHDKGMKFIVKGIMTPDEAVIAADAGADAVLVSNHGGRVLDHTPGTAEMLPSIADAVGDRVVVMLDGGIRSGADVLKALALGADITLICRPVMIAVHADEETGLATYFAALQDELRQAMRMTGCADIASIDSRIIC